MVGFATVALLVQSINWRQNVDVRSGQVWLSTCWPQCLSPQLYCWWTSTETCLKQDMLMRTVN